MLRERTAPAAKIHPGVVGHGLLALSAWARIVALNLINTTPPALCIQCFRDEASIDVGEHGLIQHDADILVRVMQRGLWMDLGLCLMLRHRIHVAALAEQISSTG